MGDDWRVKAVRLLREGWGVEDIALLLTIPQDDVRLLVRALRASGRLAGMFKTDAAPKNLANANFEGYQKSGGGGSCQP
jgi:hypothetical protein